ncbi:MAG: hypothetical protein KDD33_06330 [Bdellovibrionales bacterium]|nr:hypothetical protein [Bdellovibrionales bacterium]
MRSLFLLSIVSLFCVQCMNFEDVRRRRTAPEVRDLPRQAREDNVGLRRRVIVLPFLNLSPYPSDNAANIARNSLVSYLNQTGEVLVLDVNDLATDITSYQEEDGYNIKKLLPVIRKVGAHGIVVGRIKEIKTKKIGDSVGVFRKVKAQVKTLVDIEMYSVKSGSILASEVRSATIEEDVTRVAKQSYMDDELRDNPVLIRSVVNAAFAKMVPSIVRALRKLNWEGRVALVRGEKVYLNAGRLSGLQVGDLLRVTEAKEEVFDPETGSYLGNIRGRMKGTLEVVSYFGKDGAVTIVHSGSGFNENDIVEFY